MRIVAASSKNLMKPDKRKICYDFCRFRSVTLKGCPCCSPSSLKEFEKNKKSKSSKEDDDDDFKIPQKVKPPLPPPPPPPPVRAPLFNPMVTSLPVYPVPHRAVGSFQTTTDATTPDWMKVCAQLCRGGSGGLLCNCDLPPL